MKKPGERSPGSGILSMGEPTPTGAGVEPGAGKLLWANPQLPDVQSQWEPRSPDCWSARPRPGRTTRPGAAPHQRHAARTLSLALPQPEAQLRSRGAGRLLLEDPKWAIPLHPDDGGGTSLPPSNGLSSAKTNSYNRSPLKNGRPSRQQSPSQRSPLRRPKRRDRAGPRAGAGVSIGTDGSGVSPATSGAGGSTGTGSSGIVMPVSYPGVSALTKTRRRRTVRAPAPGIHPPIPVPCSLNRG
jgi:hypothetical protein